MLPSAKDLEGKRVPNAMFKSRVRPVEGRLHDDIFKGKTVVVFSRRGAYTPTCSVDIATIDTSKKRM